MPHTNSCKLFQTICRQPRGLIALQVQFLKFSKFRLIGKHKSIVMENHETTLLSASLWSFSCSQGEYLQEKLQTCDGSLGMSEMPPCSCFITLLKSCQKVSSGKKNCVRAGNIQREEGFRLSSSYPGPSHPIQPLLST